MELKLAPDLCEFLRSLIKHEVQFLLVGGYAVAIHGYIRATNEIDFWIEGSLENASRAEAAIREFGFDLPSLSAQALSDPGKLTTMGHPPLRIEV